jgi:hypothetical protein
MINDGREEENFLWRSLVDGKLTKLSKKTSPVSTRERQYH